MRWSASEPGIEQIIPIAMLQICNTQRPDLTRACRDRSATTSAHEPRNRARERILSASSAKGPRRLESDSPVLCQVPDI
jgi:hypothetical protein